jgi:hypothetical protein
MDWNLWSIPSRLLELSFPADKRRSRIFPAADERGELAVPVNPRPRTGVETSAG